MDSCATPVAVGPEEEDEGVMTDQLSYVLLSVRANGRTCFYMPRHVHLILSVAGVIQCSLIEMIETLK